MPGGKAQPEETPWQTALREAEEELGVRPDQVRPMGALRTRFSKTGIAVTPVVGMIDPWIELQPDPGEVDHAFWVPLDRFLPPQRPRTVVAVEPGRARSSLCYWYRNYRIWGLTARVLHELAEGLSSGQLRR